nr:hypothetical protein [Tanacetum cinerariifolium]
MSTLKFAEVHNLVAFLSKPTESKGFDQIVDFMNANPIQEVQLQALVDRKKVIITESTVRRDLQLEDAEGVDCLPNAAIFEQLTLMGSKTTAWNEFSSTMASAIICLASNQKFNFSKYIFESMVKNFDNVKFFLMYPRKTKRKDTELPQTSGPTTNIAYEDVNEEMDDSLVRAATTGSSLDAVQDSGGGPECQEVMRDTIAKTRSENNKVLELENIKTTQALEIDILKRRVKKLEKKQSLGENASKQERIIDDIDADEGITLVDETAKNQGRFNDQQDAEMLFDVADDLRALMEIKSAKPKVDKVVIQEPEQGASTYINSFFTTTIIETEAKVTEGSSKRAGEELEQENAKKQKMEDDKESVNLKQCLEIIPEDGDDVTIDATPLSFKSLTIIDYKIHKEGKKSYF